MRTGRPIPPLALTEEERETLERWARRPTTARALAERARLVLEGAAGKTNTVVARELRLTKQTIGKWRMRFVRQRLDGLLDEPRPGAPRRISDGDVERVMRLTLETTPRDATHWSTRAMARRCGLSQSAVSRIWRAFSLRPHRVKTFKLSKDPLFIEKVRDIVGLYLNPPDKALVLCVDEKAQIQALDRTQPVLPMGLGYVEGVTHDYYRHGTTTLFAALNVANGEVITQWKPRHRHQEFLAFLRHVDDHVPAALDLHLILDNYATHKHPKVKAWLAKHPRFHTHYTPTYASWLNQVERWFGLITQQALKRASTRSVKQLVAEIQKFVDHYNLHASPFAWTATADSILAKIDRLCKLIYGTQH